LKSDITNADDLYAALGGGDKIQDVAKQDIDTSSLAPATTPWTSGRITPA
jgi:hypothetical protein